MKKIFILILFIYTYNLNAQVSADFLNSFAGSKNIASGEAVTALSNSYFFIQYNPAILSDLNKNNFVFSQSKKFDLYDVNFYGFNFKSIFDFAISYKTSSIDDVQRDNYGNFLTNFSNKYQQLQTTISKKINNISLGISASYYKQNIYSKTDNVLAFDIGYLQNFKIDNQNIKLGFAIRNLGSKIKNYNLPLQIRLGFSIDFPLDLFENFKNNIVISSDYVNNKIYSDAINFGLNIFFNNDFSLNLGYQNYFDDDNLISFGLNVGYKYAVLSYAFRIHPELDDEHIFSLDFKF